MADNQQPEQSQNEGNSPGDSRKKAVPPVETTEETEEEKSAEVDMEDASGGVGLPPTKKKPSRGHALVERAKYKNKCLTCEQPGHRWRDCPNACAHCLKNQRKRVYHGGKLCPDNQTLYKKLGSVVQTRVDFERTAKAKAALQAEAEKRKAVEEARAQAAAEATERTRAEFSERERVVYQRGFADGEDRAREQSIRTFVEAREPPAPPPQQQQQQQQQYRRQPLPPQQEPFRQYEAPEPVRQSRRNGQYEAPEPVRQVGRFAQMQISDPPPPPPPYQYGDEPPRRQAPYQYPSWYTALSQPPQQQQNPQGPQQQNPQSQPNTSWGFWVPYSGQWPPPPPPPPPPPSSDSGRR